MRDPLSLATGYLTPPALAFWRWSENGRVITWNDGTTIAFREELEHVLARLAPAGLPPFGAVVLLLSACRPGWRETGRPSIANHTAQLEHVGTLDGRFPPPWIREVFDGLDGVHRTKLELRTGADAKAVLADLVFEGVEGRGAAEDAGAIVKALGDGLGADPRESETISKWLVFRFLQDLAVLRQGVARVSDEALELRRRTGLDTLPVPAPVEDVAVADAVRRLLAELRDDRELAGLARLAENLMAAVHVPRRVSDPEELPLGGVSDITNRGPLDRLLVSELAHDESTLAARVALNEALYLRREQPPRNLPGRRAILLDAGIRMWGVPRVFGTAVALALAATADRATKVTVWRATADGVAPVDLGTREGLVAHLEALEAAPAPAAGVAAFLKKTLPGPDPVDAILVTHEDVLADPEFQAALEGLEDRALDVAAVTAEGRYRMVAVTRRGRRLLREATLSLADVLTPPRPTAPRGAPLLPATHDPAFPVILSLDPFPLLLPHELDARRTAPHPEHGVVALTRDGRLMHWGPENRAARQLTALVPRGTFHWLALDDEARAYAVVGSSRAAISLLTAELESGRCTLARLPSTGYPPLGVFRHHDALVLAYAHKMDVFDIRSGEILEVHPLPPGSHWVHDRYFRDRDGWSCVAFDGMAATFVPVRGPRARLDQGLLALWDRPGHDGPWAVTFAGQVAGLADGKEIRFRHDLTGVPLLEGVARDGNRVLLRGTAGNRRATVLLDLGSGSSRWVYGDPWLELEPAVAKLPRGSVRHKFASIGVDTSQVTLLGKHGQTCSIGLAPDGKSIRLTYRASVPLAIEVPFVSSPAPAGVRYTLKVATWRDGSRAWLDSRGLLHLKSADARVPEICLVLADDGRVAGWTSDGRLCGPAYYVGDKPVSEAHAVFTALFRFAGGLR